MSPVLTQHVSQPITLDEQTQKMRRHLLQDIRRSAYVCQWLWCYEYRLTCSSMCSPLQCYRYDTQR